MRVSSRRDCISCIKRGSPNPHPLANTSLPLKDAHNCLSALFPVMPGSCSMPARVAEQTATSNSAASAPRAGKPVATMQQSIYKGSTELGKTGAAGGGGDETRKSEGRGPTGKRSATALSGVYVVERLLKRRWVGNGSRQREQYHVRWEVSALAHPSPNAPPLVLSVHSVSVPAGRIVWDPTRCATRGNPPIDAP